MQPARSLVITPLSTVSTHTFSNVWQNLKGDNTEGQIMMQKYSGHIKWCHSISTTHTLSSQDSHPICLCVPALWSKQRCWRSGWCWWVSPAKKKNGVFKSTMHNIASHQVMWLWSWPSDVHGSAWWRCHEQLQPQLSSHQDTLALMSWVPESQNLKTVQRHARHHHQLISHVTQLGWKLPKQLWLTNPVPGCQTAHHHRNSYKPKQKLRKTSRPEPPCRQWDGAHTRSSSFQTLTGTPWRHDEPDIWLYGPSMSLCLV